MTLMVICDARYIFTLVDIGSFGSNNNSGVFRNSPMGQAFSNDGMSLTVAVCLEDSPTSEKVPCFLLGDEAFPLQSWLLRPYPDHIQEYPKNKGFSIIDYLGHIR